MQESLSARVLETAEDQRAIAHLRQYADSRPGCEPDSGIVVAIFMGSRAIAAVRFIPSGQAGNWEVGRPAMAPEDRRAGLLPRCLSLALQLVMRREGVRCLQATCPLGMTRLYCELGFSVQGTAKSSSGEMSALVCGDIAAVATALQVPASPLHQSSGLAH